MQLSEWTKIFIKQRDMMKNEIVSLDETKEGFTLTKKNGEEEQVVVSEQLEVTALEQKPTIVVCLNTRDNIETLITHWETFAKDEKVLLIFANPETNEKWLLKPHLHNKIADKESLKQGLESMHSAINSA